MKLEPKLQDRRCPNQPALRHSTLAYLLDLGLVCVRAGILLSLIRPFRCTAVRSCPHFLLWAFERRWAVQETAKL